MLLHTYRVTHRQAEGRLEVTVELPAANCYVAIREAAFAAERILAQLPVPAAVELIEARQLAP